MKLAFAAGVLLSVGATGVASAADMALKARPVVAPVYNWTGCYIGGNVGAGFSRIDTTRVQPTVDNFGREDDTAFIGGGQAGCDFQTGSLVFGVQGQLDFGNVNGRHSLTDFPTMSETNSLRSVSTGTGRIGYLFTPAVLAYGKVGVAFMRNRNQVLLANGTVSESASFTSPGMTAGGGLEWMVTPNWSVFAEYNYMWITNDAAQSFTPAGDVINTRQTVQTALVGVNYKFHWDGPVVAKY